MALERSGSAVTKDRNGPKVPVLVASTANIDLSAPGASIDGKTMTATSRDTFLAKNQTAGAENGIYRWNGAAVPATRIPEADANGKIRSQMTVRVQEGTANAGKEFKLDTLNPIVVDTTALVFSEVAGGGGGAHAATHEDGGSDEINVGGLSGVLADLQNTLFGSDYQTAISTGRSTTTSSTPQTKTTLTTPALTGTYRVSWIAVVDDAGALGEVRLQNTTDAALVGAIQIHKAADTAARLHAGGFAEIVFAGVAKTFEIQFNDQAGSNTQGIQDARIEIWKVSA